MLAAVESDGDAVVGEGLDGAGYGSRLGMVKFHVGAEWRPGVGFKDGAGCGNLAKRRRHWQFGDQNAHPPAPPSRGHRRTAELLPPCPHLPSTARIRRSAETRVGDERARKCRIR